MEVARWVVLVWLGFALYRATLAYRKGPAGRGSLARFMRAVWELYLGFAAVVGTLAFGSLPACAAAGEAVLDLTFPVLFVIVWGPYFALRVVDASHEGPPDRHWLVRLLRSSAELYLGAASGLGTVLSIAYLAGAGR